MKGGGLFRRRGRTLIQSLVLACIALFSGEKVYEYAAPPDKKEKDCTFAFPGLLTT
jgi:hypothetical protein